MEKINPELKSFQTNNSFTLLAPIVNCFSQDFKESLNNSHVRCWAVGDCVYSKIHKKDKLDPFLFILVDRNGQWLDDKKRYFNIKEGKKQFTKNLQVMRKDPHYVADYSWNYLDHRHVVAFQIPKKYYNAFSKFIKGKYSEMYSDSDIEILKMKSNKVRMDIITRNKDFIPLFEKGLNNYYRTNITLDDNFDGELSLPFIPEREVFNWSSEFRFLVNILKESLNHV